MRTLILFLIIIQAAVANSERGQVITCTTHEGGDQTRDQIVDDFLGQTKVSGLLMKWTETAQEFGSYDPSETTPEELIKMYSDRDIADLKNAFPVSYQVKKCEPPGSCTICGIFWGDIIFQGKVRDEPMPPADQKPVPASELDHTQFALSHLTAGILEGSPWTKEDVSERFHQVKQIYGKCGVDIENILIVSIPNPDGKFDNLVDTTDNRDSYHLLTNFERQVGQMLAPVELPRPAIVYLKNFKDPLFPADDCSSPDKSFDERNSPKGSPVIGLAFIAGDESPKSREKCPRVQPDKPGFLIEAHELGHLLMGIGPDDNQPGNVMSLNDRGTDFTPEQCAIIRDSPYIQRRPK